MLLQQLITVVIPTHNRNSLLRKVLNGFACQTIPQEMFSVIVVDDASDIPAIELKELYPHIDFVRLDVRGGVVKARNEGLSRAKTDRLLFLDDDMIPHSALLEKHLNASKTGDIVVGYRFELINSNIELAIINQDMLPDIREESYAINTCNMSSWHIPWSACHGNNFSAPANLLRRVGGFDVNFEGWGCEDLELAYKLQHQGASFILSREAIAYHQPHSRNSVREAETALKNGQLFLLKHNTYDIELWLAKMKKKLKQDIRIYRTIADLEKTLQEWVPDWLTQSDLPHLDEPCAFFCAGSHVKSTNAYYIFHPSLTTSSNYSSLLGIDIPLPSKSFNSIVLSSMCLQTPYLIDALLEEAKRLASYVYINIPDIYIEKFNEISSSFKYKIKKSNLDKNMWIFLI